LIFDKKEKLISDGNGLVLTFSPDRLYDGTPHPETLNKPITHGTPEYLDVLILLYNDKLVTPYFQRNASYDWENLFKCPGIYDLEVVVSSLAHAASEIHLRLNFSGQRSTTTLTDVTPLAQPSDLSAQSLPPAPKRGR
jgi:hypothetical protein